MRAAPILLAMAVAGCAASPAPVAGGSAGQDHAVLDGEALTVFTYRPAGCTPTAMLLVFHGLERNAAGYRDDAVPLAQRYCMVVAAPLFDAERFPVWRYQRGGIAHDGVVQPASAWTVRFEPLLVAWVRQRVGRMDLPVVEIGHSAGAQFLSRVAAFSPGVARRFVIANPSTWVEPSLAVPAPYGFGGVADGDAALRRYLAAPVTVLLGREDRGGRHLARGPEADDQGANRFERGQAAFAQAKAAAEQRGWPCNWTLAVVPGVGHDARAMFTSDAAFAASGP